MNTNSSTTSPYGTTNPSQGPNDVSSTGKNHHTGSDGVQPVHKNETLNKLDPRVDSDRTSSNPQQPHGSSSEYNNSSAPAITGGSGLNTRDHHNPSSGVHSSHATNELNPRTGSDRHHATGGVGHSPIGTSSHNSTTSNYDARPVGDSDRHHYDSASSGALGNDRSIGHDSTGLSSGHISSGDRSLGHDHHQHGISSVTGPSLTGTDISGGANVDSHTAGVSSNPLGPALGSVGHGHVHTNEFTSGSHHGSTGGTFGVNPTHENAHTGQAGVQPVHNSQAANKIDPRVDSDRTTGSAHGVGSGASYPAGGVQHGSHGLSSHQTPNSMTGKSHESTIGGGGGIGRGNTHDGTGAGVDARDKNGDGLVSTPHGAAYADGHHNTSSGLPGSNPSTHNPAHNTSNTAHDMSNDAHRATGAAHHTGAADGHKPTLMEKVKDAIPGLH